MRTFLKYVLLQIPGWLLAALLLGALWRWVDLPLWVPASALVLWIAKDFVLYPLLRAAYEARAPTGVEQLMGAPGVVHERLGPAGSVKVRGELWSAEADPPEPPLPSGTPIRVCGARGLRLIVVADRRDVPPSDGDAAPPHTR